MARILCGNCGDVHASAAEVRACHVERPNPTPGGATGGPLADEPPPFTDDELWIDEPTDLLWPEDATPRPARSPAATRPRADADTRKSPPPRTPAGGRPADRPPAPATPRRPTANKQRTVAPPRPLAELAGPPWLGRNLVLMAGAPAPSPWDDALVVTIDEQALAEPEKLVAVLLPRWHQRQRTVFELATPFRPEAPPPVPPPDGELWDIAPTYLIQVELLHHLVWANAIDARQPDRPVWPWAGAALDAGATPPPSDPAAPDVVLPDGRAAWCDGGPPSQLAEPDGTPILHRIALERGSLQPLGPNVTLADLAPDQVAAVTHPGGAARIIAPAGSGKTRVLTERARLLLQGWQAPASATCLVAFNKRAADEMVARTPDLPGLQVRTLNALGYAILDGRPPFARRTDRRFEVLDERGVRRILDGLVNLPRQRRRVNTDPMAPWLDALSAVRLGLRDPSDVEADLAGDVEGLGDVVVAYRRHLAERHQLDFDEQIVAAIEVLLREPETRLAAQQACRLLLVDEFQDLTPAHLLLVRLLASPDLAVFAVGDDDQTIYGYTGATPEWLIGYSELFPGAGDHPLQVNYRCPPAVVAAADRLLRHNRRRVVKAIHPRPDRLNNTAELIIRLDPDTTKATVDAVSEALAAGAQPDQIAVLTRVNASLAPVQVALRHAGVPVRSAVDQRWLERTGVRAALGWLRLATQPQRLRAADLADTARRPSRGLSVKVVEWMGEQRDLAGLERLAARLRERDGDKISAYIADLRMLVAVAERATTFEVLRAVRDRIGLDEAMNLLDSSQHSVKGSAQGDDLDALVALARLHPEPTSFESWLRDQLAHPEARPAGGSGSGSGGGGGEVMLSSVHAVKGREWPYVVVHEASAGLFPHRLADDHEEERRVFHVAITRASRCCTVVAGETPSTFVAELSTDPPVFVAEAPGPRPRDTTAPDLARPSRAARPSAGGSPAAPAGPAALALRAALRQWRGERARRDSMPAYVVFHDATLDLIADTAPRTLVALSRLKGIGPAKLDRYGDEVLGVIGETLGD